VGSHVDSSKRPGTLPRGSYMVENALWDLPITLYAKAVYLALRRFADSDGECWPHVKTIAEKLGCSDRRVADALKELLAVGLLTYESGKLQGHYNTYRVYKVNDVFADEYAPHADRGAHDVLTGCAPSADRCAPSADQGTQVVPTEHTHREQTQMNISGAHAPEAGSADGRLNSGDGAPQEYETGSDPGCEPAADGSAPDADLRYEHGADLGSARDADHRLNQPHTDASSDTASAAVKAPKVSGKKATSARRGARGFKTEAGASVPPATRQVIEQHARLFHAQTGQPFVPSWGKHTKVLEPILHAHGLEGTLALQKRFFESKTAWWVKERAYDIPVFVSVINSLVSANGVVTTNVTVTAANGHHAPSMSLSEAMATQTAKEVHL
jgi:hypothetical protein